jgi:hypothetical protein
MGAWYSKALLAEIQTGRKSGNGADAELGACPDNMSFSIRGR